jgi:hypothetical protein
MICFNKRRFLVALALAFSSNFIQAKDAIVLVDSGFHEIKSGYSSSAAYSSALEIGTNYANNAYTSQTVPGLSAGQAAGAGLVGGLIAGAIIASAEQKAANNRIANFTSLVTKKELEAIVNDCIRAGMEQHGMENVKLVSMGSPSESALEELPQWGDKPIGITISGNSTPIVLTSDRKFLAISFIVTFYERKGPGYTKLNSRKVTAMASSVESNSADIALYKQIAKGKKEILESIKSSVNYAILKALTLKQTETETVSKNDSVQFINAHGAQIVAGKIIDRSEGRIVVADSRGNIGIFDADVVF